MVTGPGLASSGSIFTLDLPAQHSQDLLLGMVGWAPLYSLDSAAHPEQGVNLVPLVGLVDRVAV